MSTTRRRRLGDDLPSSVRDSANEARLPTPLVKDEIVTAADLSHLPATVQRYFEFMQVRGRPRDRSFRGSFVGRFRLRPTHHWMPLVASEYCSSEPIARIFRLGLATPYLLPMIGEDTYIVGRGQMVGTLGGLLTVARGAGPAYDAGELVTYLNDTILVAPGMLLGRATWSSRNGKAFDVTLTDRDLTVSATVVVDSGGAPVEFTTMARSIALPRGPVRARWTTPISGWRTIDGRPLPTRASAIWDLPGERFIYADGRFIPSSMSFNVDLADWSESPLQRPAVTQS